MEEKQPLLHVSKTTRKTSYGTEHDIIVQSTKNDDIVTDTGGVHVDRTLGLPTAIAILISTCTGSGIFVSPTGVTEQVGSVGLSLIIWAFCGVFNMTLALCYAELGTAIPVAGGDYAYIEAILGPLPAFLCLWVMIVLLGPCAVALMGRSAGEYFATIFASECHTALIVVTAVFIVVSAAFVNVVSVKWAGRVASIFSVGKMAAMLVIALVGIVKLAQGYTDNFENMFEGSNFSLRPILVSIIPGFVTYGGWDCVNALAEEMKNPKRDIPLTAVVGLLMVTVVYVLMNVAYFTVLSPTEFVQSSVVATSFSNKAMPGVPWLVPLFVVISATGAAFGLFLVAPRWTYAGGRNGQIPAFFSYLHIDYHTPVPAIAFLMLVSIFFCVATFFDLQQILAILGLFVQMKILLALVALLYLKYKRPDTPRSVKVPFPIVLLCMLLLVVIIVTSVYESPLVMGGGVALFFLGIPLYFVKGLIEKAPACFDFSESVTGIIQQLMNVVPERPKTQ